MKTILIKVIILFSTLMFLCSKCSMEDPSYNLDITNNSRDEIGCYFYLVWKGGYEGIVYPDTTLVQLKTNEVIGIKSGQTYHGSRSLSPITDWVLSLPNDTLSVFFFSQDTLNTYSWEEIKQEYNVLQRYDLSVEDIIKLYDEHGVPEIPYPPTVVMKGMKMYPPYEE